MKRSSSLIKRIIEISFKYKSSHIGSCLSTADLLDAVYSVRKNDEPVVLSNGHAGLALYAVLEKYGYADAEMLFKKHGVHPNRDMGNGIYVSTGSLGQGLPIAAGMALSDRSRKVYCIISDGECAEGSIWEAIRIAGEQKLHNLNIILNANGLSAYDEVNINLLPARFKAFGAKVLEVNGHKPEKITKAINSTSTNKPLVIIAETIVEHLSFLKGVDAHYKVMNELDYEIAVKELNI